MITVITGKTCECKFCKWVGPHALVMSMAGFEFCPSCLRRYTGFMPESTQHSVQRTASDLCPHGVSIKIGDCPKCNPVATRRR